MNLLLRIQDADGRGPFRPGFTKQWASSDGPPFPPSILEMPRLQAICRVAHRQGLHLGAAAFGLDGLRKWFSITEIARLSSLGFSIVDAPSCKIEARDDAQALISSKMPLRLLPVYEAAYRELTP